MATKASDQLYPFSTQNGEFIPLEIIRPTGIISKSFTISGVSTIAFPATMQLAGFYSEEGCIIDFSNTLSAPLADGTLYSNALIVPPQMLVSSVILSPTAKVIGLKIPGVLLVQGIYKWAALALSRQLTTGN